MFQILWGRAAARQVTGVVVTRSCGDLATVTVNASPQTLTDQNPATITGCNWGTTTGMIHLCNGSTYTGSTSCVAQTPSAWNPTQASFTVAIGTLAAGSVYLYVHNAANQVNAFGLPVQILAFATACATPLAPQANEVYTASAAFADVNTALTTAYNTPAINTVCVHAGTASWTQALNLTGAKAITIRGAGTPQCAPANDTATVILNTSGSPANDIFNINASATAFTRITNFTLKWGNSTGDHLIGAGGTDGDVALRIDHNRLYDNNLQSTSNRLLHWEFVYGLVDCNYFQRDAFGQSAEIFGDASSDNDRGFAAWARPLNWGIGIGGSTNQAVYFENNTFVDALQQEGFLDQYEGSRVVFRHNTGIGNSNGDHGFDSQPRSAFSYEQYNNVFTNNSSTMLGGITQLRGGTLLAFNDTYNGSTAWADIKLVYYRGPYCAAFYTPFDYLTRGGPLNNITCGATGDWNLELHGQLDGTYYDIAADHSASVIHNAATGTRFSVSHPDTTCTGPVTADCNRGVDCQTGLAGCGTDGYPGRDQPGITHDQKSAPIYAWNNGSVHISTDSGDQSSPLACANPNANPKCTISTSKNTSYWVAENRDYYNASTIQTDSTHPFNGTAQVGIGMGWGPGGLRPTSCTVGTAYFSQNVGPQGTLYQCGPAANQWSVYYTPYTYPHPLSTTP